MKKTKPKEVPYATRCKLRREERDTREAILVMARGLRGELSSHLAQKMTYLCDEWRGARNALARALPDELE